MFSSRYLSIVLLSFLLTIHLSFSSAATTVQFCIDDTTGVVTNLNTTCAPHSHPYQHIGTNLYDILWDVWSPSDSGTGNITTTLKTIHDAAASGITVARVFAVPWAYTNTTWGWYNVSTREEYFLLMDTVLAETTKMGIQIIPMLGYGCPDTDLTCNPSRLCTGETYRDMITNASSCTRQLIYAYAKDVVERYHNHTGILFWELGNEMNLAMDGCSYDKSDGAFFTTNEAMQFLKEYSTFVKSFDPWHRPVNTGMAAPRLRAYHLANIPGGGKNCVSPLNPKGDCDLYCPSVPFDTLQDTQTILNTYYGDHQFDMMSIHWYGCAPPNGNYSWCPYTDNATTVPLSVFKDAADSMNVALYVGEFGPSTTAVPTGWGPEPWAGQSYISAMLEYGIRLSTMWAFECYSHRDMGGLCIHPGDPDDNLASFTTLENMQYVDRALQGLPPSNLNLTLYMLDPAVYPLAACLDGSPYGYYAKLGRDTTKWVVMLQGGGWCPGLFDCYERTLPAYSGSTLGSSKLWSKWSWGWWFGPNFVDASYLYLPYCDGASYSGFVLDPVPTTYGPNQNTTLYFRGAVNLEAAITDALLRFNVSTPGTINEIIVTGGSAGGLSTTLHVDRLQTLMNSANAYGVPQCGFFAFYNETCQGTNPSEWCNATAQFNHTFHMHNASGTMIPECLEAYPGDAAYNCFMAPVATQYVKSPLFIWQSKFDHFQLNAFVDIDCMLNQTYNPPWNSNVTCNARDTNLTMNYGELFMNQIQPYLTTPGPFRAVYLTSCVLHGMDYNYLSVEDTNPNTAFNLWYEALRDPTNAPTMDNDYKWIEDNALPRIDNNLACPPFIFTPS